MSTLSSGTLEASGSDVCSDAISACPLLGNRKLSLRNTNSTSLVCIIYAPYTPTVPVEGQTPKLHSYVCVPPTPAPTVGVSLRRLIPDSEDTQGVGVGWSRLPATQAHHRGAVLDTAQFASPVDAGNKAFLHVHRPAGAQWFVVEQRVQPSVHVALQGEGGGEGTIKWRGKMEEGTATMMEQPRGTRGVCAYDSGCSCIPCYGNDGTTRPELCQQESTPGVTQTTDVWWE